MGSDHSVLPLLCLVFALTIIQGIHAIIFRSNGCLFEGEAGNRFREVMDDDKAILIMKAATEFTWGQVLEQSSPSDRKDVQIIYLLILQQNSPSSHHRYNHHAYFIHLGADFIKSCPIDHLERRITRQIYFQIANILQWATTRDRKIMGGISHFAILEANYGPKTLVKYGDGDKWDQNSEVTAQFLQYCNDRKHGFVAFLNREMRKYSSFKESYFQEFFHESIDDLWKDYKNKYGKA